MFMLMKKELQKHLRVKMKKKYLKKNLKLLNVFQINLVMTYLCCHKKKAI